MATRRQGRMAKTQTIPVRLDPVLKWAAELAAGKERRSLNSFVEWAVEQAVKRVDVAVGYVGVADLTNVSAWEVANKCWHLDPLSRLRSLATNYYDALTVKERIIADALGMLECSYGKNFERFLDTQEMWEVLERFGAEEIDMQEMLAAIKSIHEKSVPF